ncbi:hypothetical protein AQUCO_00200118v1 [Aquilegia coerulea]|uniref:Uncharacterized protein n=1 Tax=Aquilegia coerulea TaxID=218851 RepID=A0A2G5F1Q3_AQUCA|nr:hypothetical protein AQUCO_00200118v1 [Aquilegia coerulea]
MAYQNMYTNEVSYQLPTLSLRRPMNQIRPMVGSEFSFDEVKSSQGGLFQDFRYVNQYHSNGKILKSDYDISILSFVRLNIFVYGNSNRDLVGSMSVVRKGDTNEIQYENYSDSLRSFENKATTQDQNQMFLDLPKNDVHAHVGTCFGFSNMFPCVTTDNQFVGEVSQIKKSGTHKRKNNEAFKESFGSIKGNWTHEEDRKLVRLVEKHGEKNWAKVSSCMGGRIGKQCRDRWKNHLEPGINKGCWTEDEDMALVEGHKKHNNRWAKIAEEIPGRTDNAVKNRWNSVKRRQSPKEKKYCHSKNPLPSPILQEYINSVSNKSTGSTNKVGNAATSDCYIPMDDTLAVPIAPADQGGEFVALPSLPFNFDVSIFEEEMFSILNEGITDNVMPSDVDHLNPYSVNKEMDLFEMISEANI